jgi:hypothetical protein
MSSEPKVPLERRRRNNLWEGMLGILTHSRTAPMRRESDMIRSRMQRWVELADSALGKRRTDSGPIKPYPPELRNNKH